MKWWKVFTATSAIVLGTLGMHHNQAKPREIEPVTQQQSHAAFVQVNAAAEQFQHLSLQTPQMKKHIRLALKNYEDMEKYLKKGHTKQARESLELVKAHLQQLEALQNN